MKNYILGRKVIISSLLLIFGLTLGYAGTKFDKVVNRISAEKWFSNWVVFGPYSNDSDIGFDRDYLTGEKNFEYSEGILQSARVIKTVSSSSSGLVNFIDIFGKKENVVGYAWSELIAPKDGLAMLKVGSDDGVKVWLNHELVLSNHAHRGAAPDQENVAVKLKKGSNRCLVKVEQGTGDWGFYFRFGELLPAVDGESITGLKNIIPPVLLVGSQQPIEQWLTVPVMNNGSVNIDSAYLYLTSSAFDHPTKSLITSLSIGKMEQVNLLLNPKEELKPHQKVVMKVYADTKENPMRELITIKAKSREVHPLLSRKLDEPAKHPSVVRELYSRTYFCSGAELRHNSVRNVPSVVRELHSRTIEPAKQNLPFRFIHLTDTHIVDENSILLQVKTAERLKQAVDEINALVPSPEFVMVTGDILLNEMRGYPLFTKIMNKLKMPYVCTFGNHDKPAGLPAAAKVFSEWGYPPYYSFDFHGIHFIILDAVNKINPQYGHITLEQLAWLEKDLDRNQGELTFLFLHHDLFSGTGVENYQEVRAVLSKYSDVQWVFGGHWHADTFVQEGNLRHILTTSPGYQFPVLNMKWSRGIPGFRLVDVDGRNIKTSFKPLGKDILPDPEPNQYLTPEEIKLILKNY
jgi:hypothetical protein